MRRIAIEKIGPIEYLELPIPENGGVVVLRGRNGVGKSWALQAVDCLASGRGTLPVRDGATRGTVSGIGVTLTVERSVRRRGTAEVVSLDGRFDISEFVTPPIADPDAADRRRIKALVQLSGLPARADDFVSILPSGVSLDDLVPASERSEDPVVLAGQIKRSLEEEARRLERATQQFRAEADALRKQIPPGTEHVVTTEKDREEALTELHAALTRLTELETRATETQRLLHLQEMARQQLADLSRDYTEPEVYEAQLEQIDRVIHELEQQLAAVRERRQQLLREKEKAVRTGEQLSRLREILNQTVPLITESELTEARERHRAAQERYDTVIRMLEITKLGRRVRDLETAAQTTEKRATELRNAAWATDQVLTSMVARVTDDLRVHGGRLVVQSHRGMELFADLSLGERWRLALEIFAKLLPPNGILVAKQEAWEALDPTNKREIVLLAKRLGVTIFTAEADDSEHISIDVLE
jgi:DNA repair ATPase RecN